MTWSHSLRTYLFSAGVLGCLGFGSAQAFASQGPDPATQSTLACYPTVCTAGCLAKGYYGGTCTTDRGCVCYRLEE